jgi:hypothetical protein
MRAIFGDRRCHEPPFSQGSMARTPPGQHGSYGTLYEAPRPSSLFVHRWSLQLCQQPSPKGSRWASQLDEGGPAAQIRRAIEALGVCMIRTSSPEAKSRVREALRDAPGSAAHDDEAQGLRTIEGAISFVSGKFVPCLEDRRTRPPLDGIDVLRSVDGYDFGGHPKRA